MTSNLSLRIFVDIFFFIGIIFSAIGVIGIIRGKDIFRRIQSSMVIYSLGVFPILVALSVYNLSLGNMQGFIKIIIAIVVLFIVMPLLNSLLLRKSYHSNKEERTEITINQYGRDKND